MSTLEELIQKQFDLYVSGVWMDIYSDIKENTEIGGGMYVKFFKDTHVAYQPEETPNPAKGIVIELPVLEEQHYNEDPDKCFFDYCVVQIKENFKVKLESFDEEEEEEQEEECHKLLPTGVVDRKLRELLEW